MGQIGQTELQAFLDGVERLLGARSGEADVRAALERPEGFDRALWRELADLGVAGLLVDERYGGVGAGPVELERVMEAAGAALLCSPMLGSSVLAAGLLQALGDADACERLLPGLAAGERVAAVALTGGARADWTPASVQVTASGDSGQPRLSGSASFVLHGQAAETLLVVARTPDGFGVFEVEAGASGLTIRPLQTFDRTLRLAELTFENVAARRLGSGEAWPAVEAALDLGRVALAGDQAGGTRRVLEMTVDYAKTRHQFGRAIGSFQAIKHMAADLLLEAESSTSAARHAAQRLAEGAPDAAEAISLAAFACADAYVRTAADAIQMHGGIAFTAAHPAHLYLRRARAGAELFGGSALYRERYVCQLEAAL